MKKNILFLILLLTLSNSYSQYKETTVYFRDGTKKNGISKFLFLSNEIKFKKDKTQKKPEILNYKTVDKFSTYHRGEKIEYQYKIVYKVPGVKLLKVKRRGKVDLFYEVRTSSAAPMGGGAGGMGFTMGVSSSSEVYYIGKKDAPIVEKLFGLLGPTKRRFKKIVPKLFSDCEELMSLIENKKFKKGDIVEIVDFYNNDCNTTN
ncbi:MAG: hypothetical protein ACPGU6_03900 [Tenacibaculum sp.]